MQKKRAYRAAGIIAGVLLLAGTVFFGLGRGKSLALSNNEQLTLTMNASHRLHEGSTPASSEEEGSVPTALGNEIVFRSKGIVKNDSGWQILEPNGYFYNPVTPNGDHNRISGLQSLRYTGTPSSSLTLHYGYSVDNAQILYSYAETLSPNMDYFFTEGSPSYLYIKNETASNVAIDELRINYSCQAEEFPYQNKKVLMVGNSFADDTIYYLKDAAASMGINIEIHDAYIASCTLDMHYNNIRNGTATYSERSAEGGLWNYRNDKTLTQILNAEDWDIITLQQASAQIGRPNSYGNLSALVGEIRNVVGNDPHLLWHQTWAYDSDYADYYDYFSYFGNDQAAMYQAINDCYRNQVAPTGLFERMIPAGTAVQNLRTTYMKDTFTRDGKHMSSVHGRYLLALNFISSLMKIDLKMSPCPYLPTGVNASFRTVAYESIENARKTPLSATNSRYTEWEMQQYDLTNFTEIDSEIVGCGYWNSTTENYNIRIRHDQGTSNSYACTKRFTPETLPVGSIVFCREGFGFRPEAWVSDAIQGSRPDVSYANSLIIDESFWNGYAYRAFNVFKAATTELVGQYDQLFDGFHIYVPNASLGNIKVKGVNDMAAQDRNTFTNNHLKFDSFERMHLDPITGFYKCDSYYELKNSFVDATAQRFLCTVPFYSVKGDLPKNTVIIVDSGYQWRSDCWGDHGTATRPGNVAANLTKLDDSFMSQWRRRTFNVSKTDGYTKVGNDPISFFHHFRIYLPTSDDISLPVADTVTMTALGYANVNSMAASLLGRSDIPILITLHGDSETKVNVQVNGSDAGATQGYTYNKSTGAISIPTSGSAAGYTYGTISGVVHPELGTITNLGINGTLSSFVTNNGSITVSEKFFDRCDYATDAASQQVWQRWYMNGSWQANSGSGDWTSTSTAYTLDNTHSMALRIASSTNYQTRFTLRNDFNNGAGLSAKGISIWLFNPNGEIYSSFRIYLYTSPSTQSGDHATPQDNHQITDRILASGEWVNIRLGYDYATIYNVSFFFQTSNSSVTYVYLGHVSFY